MAKGVAVGVLLLLLVGIILGQTDYGYFGLQALTGAASGRSDRPGATGRAPGTTTAEPEIAIPDRPSAIQEHIVRLERKLVDSPKDEDTRLQLLETLTAYRERYPAAFAREPRFATKMKDLSIQMSPQGSLGARIQVVERIAAGQWEDAATLIESARKAFPDDIQIPYLSGRILSRLGRHEEALRHFESVLKQAPGLHAALVGKGEALLEMGKPVAAREAFETLLSREPDHAEARIGLARVALETGDLDGAIQIAREVIEKGRPGLDEEALFQAHRLLARVFTRKGGNAEAQEALRGALAIRPADEETALDLATRLLDQNKPQEALEVMRPAREAGRAGETFLLIWAKAAQADEKPDLVQAALLEGTERFPQAPSFWVLRGQIALDGRKFQSAEAAFEGALKVDRGSVDAWIGLARTLFSQGKVQAAVSRLEEATEATNGRPLILVTLAEIQEENGEFAAAEEALRRVLSRDAGNTQARQRLGLILAGQKRYEETVPFFEDLSQKGLLDRKGILGYSRVLRALHRTSQAEALLRSAASEDPKDLDLAAEHALTLMESGNLSASEALLRKILEKTPGHSLSLYYLGLVLGRRNALDEAVQTLEMACRSDTRDPRPRIALSRMLLAHRGKDGKAAAKAHLDHVLGLYGRKEVPLDQQDPEAYLMHGRILFEDQKYSAALRDFEMALGLAPMRADLLVDHARTLIEMSRHAQAKDFLRRVLANSPSHPEANFLMARIAIREGQIRAARESLERLVQRDPRSFPEAWRLLGMIYRDENLYSLARNAFQQYLKLTDSSGAEVEEVRQLLGRMH